MAWQPLESNPDVMNKMLEKFGVPKKWQIVDVYSLDSELLATVPEPVLAVILLFPTSGEVEEESVKATKSTNENLSESVKDGVLFVKQFIKNACGTIALIHSIINNADKIELADGPLKSFMEKIKNCTPDEAGELLLETNDIKPVHEEVASDGQTEAPPAESDIYFHFVCFVNVNGSIYELDGRKTAPIKYADVTVQGNLLLDAATVIKRYISRDPENIQFTVLALANVD